MRLTVRPLPHEEVYLDIVRIPEEYRLDRRGRPVEEGQVCSVECGGEEIFVIARGSPRSDPSISLDERTRNRLKIKTGETYDFELSRADFTGQARWALEASDIRYSFAARVALVSAVLGLIGLVIALLSSAVQFHLFG